MQEPWKEDVEKVIHDRAKTYLQKCRPNDYEHTVGAVRTGKKLCREEGGNLHVVVPSLYFHDAGRYVCPSSIDGMPENDLHMLEGTRIALSELQKMEYDLASTVKTAYIILIHDHPDKVFEWGDRDAIDVVEADRLYRYGIEDFNRFRKIHSELPVLEHLSWLRAGKEKWFRSQTAKKIANDILAEKERFLKENNLLHLKLGELPA